MTTRLRYAWIPIVTASAPAPTACGVRTTPVAGRHRRAGHATPRSAQPNEPGTTFEDERVSGYVDAASDPLSTFALDVDNGSYRIAQAYVAPHPPAVGVGARAEEWVNVRVRRPGADRGRPLRPRRVGRPDRRGGAQPVRVAVTAREVAAAERPSVNLTLVVDRWAAWARATASAW